MALSIARPTRTLAVIALLLYAFASAALPQRGLAQPDASDAYIVQANSAAAAAAAVVQAGGTVTHSLAIVGGVAAQLDRAALATLRLLPGIVLHADGAVRATGADDKETKTKGYYLYPAAATGATELHSQQVQTPKTTCQNNRVTVSGGSESRPLQGWGVTVAVVDSGFMQMKDAISWNYRDSATGTLVAESGGRCVVYRDFLPRSDANQNAGNNALNSVDQYGHGTHVIATVSDNRATPLANGAKAAPVGVAPQVNLVIARALDANGAGSYADVIAAIDWIVQNKDRYNIRVLNLSLYTPVSGPYWADPLNQAVMQAWRAGIVVVAAAGNDGPEAGTITVPGNVPYVISVGALRSGRYNASGSDELAAYSSRGPTESAFVKPDVLVPASRTIAPMPDTSTLAGQVAAGRIYEKRDVDFGIGKPDKQHTYYQLSGTSMAAAEVSGIVALMLQQSPGLTNDQVKYRLLTTALPALDEATGVPVYSVWEQGAGLVDTRQAVFSTATGRANTGMDINLDLTSDTHYWGNTTWDEATGQFRLIDPDTGEQLMVWDGANKVWAGANKVWAGANKVWAGANKVWAGANKVWAGANKVWAGGTYTWASSESLWAGANKVWAGSTPITSLSTASAGEMIGYADPASAPTSPVRPVLECVAANGNGTYTAYFGYQNDNPVGVSIPVGANNRFSSSMSDRGQPVVFQPGRTPSWPGVPFGIVFNGGNLVWTLNGQTATASSASAHCGS